MPRCTASSTCRSRLAPLDGVFVAIAALVISYLITIYPSSGAARVAPAEILRYE